MKTPKPLPAAHDRADAGPGLSPDQLRIQASVIRDVGRTERPAYRGGNGYPRLAGDA